MDIAICVVLVLMALKLILTALNPLQLINDYYEKNATGISFSLMTEVEVILLLIAVVLSWMSSGDSWINKPLYVAGYGLGAIIFSYILMFVIMWTVIIILHWVHSRKK